MTKDREKLTDLPEYSAAASESEPEDDLSESAISSCMHAENRKKKPRCGRIKALKTLVRLTIVYFIIINSNAYLYRNHRTMILSHPNPTIGKTIKHQRGQRRLSCKMTCILHFTVKVTHKIAILMSIHAAKTTMPLYSTSSSASYILELVTCGHLL